MNLRHHRRAEIIRFWPAWLLCGTLLAQDPGPSSAFPPPPQFNAPAAGATATGAAPSPGNFAPPDQVFEPCQILATVGDQFILAADVIPHVNQILAPHLEKIPADVLAEQRRGLIAQLTRSHIETKLLYVAFLRKIPADKVKEIHKRVEATFDQELEEERKNVEKMTKPQQDELVKKNPQVGRMVILMKERGVWTPRELDILLREYGGSLLQEKNFYVEHKLGRAVVSQNLRFDPEITYDEMLRYYGEHEKDYLIPDRVRFEVVTVRLANFNSRDEAWNAIATMGNEVYYGANFGAVAKRSSQALNAEKGGYHDWTSRGSLVSKVLDEALFTLEPGKLSTILEDERQLYIVRVLERQAAGRTPFEQVQDDIRESVRKEKISKQYEEFVTTSRQGIRITTAFDEDPQLRQVARPGENRKR